MTGVMQSSHGASTEPNYVSNQCNSVNITYSAKKNYTGIKNYSKNPENKSFVNLI